MLTMPSSEFIANLCEEHATEPRSGVTARRAA